MNETAIQTIPTESFPFSTRRRALFLTIGLFFCIAGAALLVSALFFGDKFPARARGQALLIGSLAVGGGAFAVFNSWRNRGLSASTGPDGITLTNDHRSQTCRWEEIAVVREERVRLSGVDNMPLIIAKFRGNNHVVVVEKVNGQQLRFTNLLNDLPKLADAIRRATLPILLPQALAEIADNGSANFGPVTITSQGMESEQTRSSTFSILWPNLEYATSKDGIIEIRSGDNPKSRHLDSNEIPNPHVLLALLQQHQTGKP